MGKKNEVCIFQAKSIHIRGSADGVRRSVDGENFQFFAEPEVKSEMVARNPSGFTQEITNMNVYHGEQVDELGENLMELRGANFRRGKGLFDLVQIRARAGQ